MSCANSKKKRPLIPSSDNDGKVGLARKQRKTRKPSSKLHEKNDGQPARPLNAYNIFFREQRMILLDERDALPPEKKLFGASMFAAMGKAIAERWKKLTIEEKLVFQAKAGKEKERYQSEIDAHKKKQCDALDSAVAIDSEVPNGNAAVASSLLNEASSGLSQYQMMHLNMMQSTDARPLNMPDIQTPPVTVGEPMARAAASLAIPNAPLDLTAGSRLAAEQLSQLNREAEELSRILGFQRSAGLESIRQSLNHLFQPNGISFSNGMHGTQRSIDLSFQNMDPTQLLFSRVPAPSDVLEQTLRSAPPAPRFTLPPGVSHSELASANELLQRGLLPLLQSSTQYHDLLLQQQQQQQQQQLANISLPVQRLLSSFNHQGIQGDYVPPSLNDADMLRQWIDFVLRRSALSPQERNQGR